MTQKIVDVAELLLTEENERVFSEFLKNKEIPHLILQGPPGTGKTTAAYSIAWAILSDPQCSFLELNASDDRGVDVIRGTVSNFARSSSLIESEIKILLLEESESLTPEAQMCLRRIMEVYESNFRVIFTTNNVHRIDEAIRSRSVVLSFPRIAPVLAHKLLLKSTISPEERAEIVRKSDGDIRNLLQAAKYHILPPDEISVDLINFLSKAITLKQTEIIAKKIAKNYESSCKILCNILLDLIIRNQIETKDQLKAIVYVADFELRVLRGCSIELQLYVLRHNIFSLTHDSLKIEKFL